MEDVRSSVSENAPLTVRSLTKRAVDLLRLVRVSSLATAADQRLAWRARTLYAANGYDTVAVHGALLSAVAGDSASGRLTSPPTFVDATRSEADRVASLIRVACNRARRKARGDERLSRQAASGERVPFDGAERTLEAMADHSLESPETAAQIDDLVGYVLEGLSSRDLKIYELAGQGLGQVEIGQMTALSHSTVCRVLRKLRDRLEGAIAEGS
ncbi:MAG: hypothetical protein QM770_01425 [Tepidisphaeraceae bacterium]